MIITVASGKGGTGKTTVATSLALSLAEEDKGPIFLDCDVEEPNAGLYLRPTLDQRQEAGIQIPQVDLDKCTFCGRCADVCVWHAIAVVGQTVLIFPELCHGCGSCTLNCPEDAIYEVFNPMGSLESGQAGSIEYGQGTMDVGQAMAVPIIRELKKKHLARYQKAVPVAILDAPPGTSCPVVESMSGSDYVLLVTEPTPFGLHDLRLAVQVARDELGLPVGVIVNRDGIGDRGVDDYCAAEGIPILMRIPLDRNIAQALAGGEPLVEALPEYRPQFRQLYGKIIRQLQGQEGSPS